LGAIRLSVTEDHALLAGRLDWNHRDPFDRMLAAQAMIESLVIITSDPAFAGCPGVPTLW
jgi:PIN domain nuclease of toxin-antitoxin system